MNSGHVLTAKLARLSPFWRKQAEEGRGIGGRPLFAAVSVLTDPSLRSCVSIMLGAAHTWWEVVLLAGGHSPGMDGGSWDSAGENFSSRPLEGSALGSLWANKRQAEGERCDFTWLNLVQLHKKRQTLLFAEWGQGEHISKTERFFRQARHWGNISKARERGWGKASSAQSHLPQGLRNYVNCRELLVSCKRIAHLVKSIPWKLSPVFLATAAGYHGLFPHIFSCFFFLIWHGGPLTHVNLRVLDTFPTSLQTESNGFVSPSLLDLSDLGKIPSHAGPLYTPSAVYGW